MSVSIANYSFGIAGFGFVGQAVFGSVKKPDNVYILDKYKGIGSVERLEKCSVIFCCLPTVQKEDGNQCFSEYKEFLDYLVRDEYGGVLNIKSTVLYENIKPYIDKLNIVFNPEFLNQNSAIEDFSKQKIVILGGRIDLAKKVQDVYENYFTLTDVEYEFCSLEEAIQIKYMHNIYHAYKVLFWNFAQQQTGNARKMSELYHKITDRNEMSKVGADGKLGYGGACFPKDVNAFNHVHPNELTKFMRKYNLKLRGDEK